jgi:predicted nucleic acid-binding protein
VNRVVNATVISNYAAVARLDILQTAAGPLYLPLEVYDELIDGRLAGYTFYNDLETCIEPYTTDGWLHLIGMTEDELRLSVTLPDSLHAGERACLSIARQRGWGLLTDDRAARQQARAWGIGLSGTLGVLLFAIQDQMLTLDQGNTLLGQMVVRAHYRSPVTDLSILLP